ncbi:MAG: hypothetical protein WDZ29_06745 [Balneolaceae bacterium]
MESVIDEYYYDMEVQNRGDRRTSIGILRFYTSGVSGPDGEIWLATTTRRTGNLLRTHLNVSAISPSPLQFQDRYRTL